MEEKIRVSNSILDKMDKRYKGFENCYVDKSDGIEFVESLIRFFNFNSVDKLFNLNAKVMNYREFIQFMMDNGLREWAIEDAAEMGVTIDSTEETIFEWIDEHYYYCLEHFYDDIKDTSFDWFVSEETEQNLELEDSYFFVVFYDKLNESKKKFNLKESIKKNISKMIAERKRLMKEEKLSDYEDMKPDTWWADDKAMRDVFRTSKSREYYGSDKHRVKFRKDDENAIQNTYNKIVSKPENLFAYLEHRGGTDEMDEFIPNELAKEFLFNEEFHKMFNEWLKEKLNEKFYNKFNAKPNKYADQLIDLVDEDVCWDGFVNSTSDDEHCRNDYDWCIIYAPISDNGKFVSASQYQFGVPKWDENDTIIFYLFSKLIENDRLDETGIPKYVMDYLVYEIEPKLKKYNDKRQKDAIKKQKEVSNDYESDMYDSTDDLEESKNLRRKLMKRNLKRD